MAQVERAGTRARVSGELPAVTGDARSPDGGDGPGLAGRGGPGLAGRGGPGLAGRGALAELLSGDPVDVAPKLLNKVLAHGQ
ncbi:MAG: hypothetical protein ACRDZ5_01515, partial [Acidimicrobiales bacterium]